MRLCLQLSLPRDARYVSIMRNVATSLLRDVEAPEGAVNDLRVAVSEACANVVLHAAGVDEYSANLTVDPEGCQVEIVDHGPGFDGEPPEADLEDEHGRGLALIDSLVDELEFVCDEAATRVRLVKRWEDLGLPADPAPGDQSRGERLGSWG